MKFKNCALKTEKKHEKKTMRDILLYKLNEVKKKKLLAIVQKLWYLIIIYKLFNLI